MSTTTKSSIQGQISNIQRQEGSFLRSCMDYVLSKPTVHFNERSFWLALWGRGWSKKSRSQKESWEQLWQGWRWSAFVGVRCRIKPLIKSPLPLCRVWTGESVVAVTRLLLQSNCPQYVSPGGYYFGTKSGKTPSTTRRIWTNSPCA